jgi:hypothetical protein
MSWQVVPTVLDELLGDADSMGSTEGVEGNAALEEA